MTSYLVIGLFHGLVLSWLISRLVMIFVTPKSLIIAMCLGLTIEQEVLYLSGRFRETGG